jgi:hypothetical protein
VAEAATGSSRSPPRGRVDVTVALGIRAGLALSAFVVLLALVGLAPAFSWVPEAPLLAVSVLVPLVAYAITGVRAARSSGLVRDGVAAGAVAGIISGFVGGVAYVFFGKSLLNVPVGLALGCIAGAFWGGVGAIVSVRSR